MKHIIERLWEAFPNRYEAVVVIAKEARRIAQEAREKGIKLLRKPTVSALERLSKKEIPYQRVSAEETKSENNP